MAGVGGGGRPSSAPPPQGTRLSGAAVLPSRLSRPPQHRTEGEAPSPRGRSHPSLGCTFSGFQQSAGSGGHGAREGAPRPSQRDSSRDPGLLVRPGTHSLCHLFF